MRLGRRRGTEGRRTILRRIAAGTLRSSRKREEGKEEEIKEAWNNLERAARGTEQVQAAGAFVAAGSNSTAIPSCSTEGAGGKIRGRVRLHCSPIGLSVNEDLSDDAAVDRIHMMRSMLSTVLHMFTSMVCLHICMSRASSLIVLLIVVVGVPVRSQQQMSASMDAGGPGYLGPAPGVGASSTSSTCDGVSSSSSSWPLCHSCGASSSRSSRRREWYSSWWDNHSGGSEL